MPTIRKYDDESCKDILDLIKLKLIGKARDIIKIYSRETSTWDNLKKILYQNFGGTESEQKLYGKLTSTKYHGDILKFKDEIISTLSNLIAKTEQTGTNNATSHTAYQKAALNTFIRGLPDLMSAVVQSHKPNSLAECMDVLTENNYVHQKLEVLPFDRLPKNSQHQNNTPFRTSFRNERPTQPFQTSFRPRPQFQSNNNYVRPSMPNNPNYRPNFKPNPNFNNPHPPQQSKPEPMDVDPRSSQIRRLYHNEPCEQEYYDPYYYEQTDNDYSYEQNEYGHEQPQEQNYEESVKILDPKENEIIQNFPIPASEETINYLMKIKARNNQYMRFLIDTGATISVINPNTCQPKFLKPLTKPFFVTALTGNREITHKAEIPIEAFNFPIQTKTVTFYITQFHEYLNGLIANDILIPNDADSSVLQHN